MSSISIDDLKRRMHGAVEALKHDLGGLRTGRASTALLDPIQVEVYGAHMPLNQVATSASVLSDVTASAQEERPGRAHREAASLAVVRG